MCIILLCVSKIRLVVIMRFIFVLLCFSLVARSHGSDNPSEDGSDTGSFWQISDIHYDANYSSPLFVPNLCRVSDQFRNSSTGKAGEYGDYACDSSWNLTVSAIKAMKKIASKPDFILWTGDSIPHVSDAFVDLDKIYTVVWNVTDALYEAFHDVPIYPMLGNHDVWPAHQIPVDSYNKFYEEMLTKAGWNRILKPAEQEVFKQGGYFSKCLSPGLRLICLNSNLWYMSDKLSMNETDPADQFHWLELEMNSAANRSEKVIISGHVPPGVLGRVAENVSWMYSTFNRRLQWLMQRYGSLITAAIFGHEHTDSFRIVYNNDGKPVVPVFMAPAVTPWNSTLSGMGANNPAIRLYHYRRSSGKIKDYTQYYLNLTKANILGKSKWEVEYRAATAFQMADLTADSLDKLTAKFMEDGSPQFQLFYEYNSVSLDRSLCTGQCKRRHICSMIKIDPIDYLACVHDNETLQPVVGPTLSYPEFHHSTHGHHRHHEIKQFTYYLLGAILVFLLILFFVVAFCCCRRRHAVLLMGRPRYVLIQEA